MLVFSDSRQATPTVGVTYPCHNTTPLVNHPCKDIVEGTGNEIRLVVGPCKEANRQSHNYERLVGPQTLHLVTSGGFAI